MREEKKDNKIDFPTLAAALSCNKRTEIKKKKKETKNEKNGNE